MSQCIGVLEWLPRLYMFFKDMEQAPSKSSAVVTDLESHTAATTSYRLERSVALLGKSTAWDLG